MCSNQRWFKVSVGIFNDSKMKIITSRKDGYFVACCFFKFMCLAGTVNDGGIIYINEDIPYTMDTLAIEFNTNEKKMQYACDLLIELKMLEVTEEGYLKVTNWAKYQNIAALEDLKNRVSKSRNKSRLENENKAEKEKKNTGRKKAGKTAAKEESKSALKADVNKVDNADLNVTKNDEPVNKSEISITEEDAEFIKEEVNESVCNNNNVTYINNSENESNNKSTQCNKENVTSNNKNKIKNKSKKKKEKESKKIDDSVKVLDEDENIEIIGLCETFEAKEGDVTLSEFSFDESDNNTSVSSGQLCTGVGHTVQVKQTTGSSEGMGDNAAQYSNCTNEQADAALRLNKYYESLTGIIGGLDYGQMRLNVIDHGEKYVKMAIDKAISVGIKDGKYISGILKNWRAEGYPKEDERVKNNGGKDKFNNRSSGEDKSFKLKPTEERKLTDEQRKKLEAEFLE